MNENNKCTSIPDTFLHSKCYLSENTEVSSVKCAIVVINMKVLRPKSLLFLILVRLYQLVSRTFRHKCENLK